MTMKTNIMIRADSNNLFGYVCFLSFMLCLCMIIYKLLRLGHKIAYVAYCAMISWSLQRARQAQLVNSVHSALPLTLDDTWRGLHALYSRTNAPVYHDGLAQPRPDALGRMSPRARTCVRTLSLNLSVGPHATSTSFSDVFQLRVGLEDVQGSMTRDHVPNH